MTGTGLVWRSTGANSVTIKSPSAAANTEGVVLADDGSINLNTITVSNGGNLGSHADTYQTAGSVNYISAQEVEQKRGTSVGDFISGIPVVLNGDSRNSGALDVNIRGLQGQGRVPVVIDGASQEQTVYRGYNGARSGSFVDPDFPNIGYEGLSPWKGGEEILNTSMENESLLFKGNFQLGIDHALELSFMRYTSEFGEIMPTRIGTHTSAIGVFQSEPDTLDLKTYNARYRWSPESDLIDLKINAFRTDMDHRATNLLPGWGGIVTTSVNYAQTIRNGINVSNESLIEVVPGEFRLEYGGGWQYETLGLPKDIDDKQWVINHSEFPPRSGKRTEKNVFMNGKWEITPQWKAAAGIRYSSFRTSDDNNSMKMIGNWPNFEYELIPGKVTHVSGHGISNHASLSWEPLDDLQLYGRYSDTVRMPSIFETLKGFSTAYLPAQDLSRKRPEASSLVSIKPLKI